MSKKKKAARAPPIVVRVEIVENPSAAIAAFAYIAYSTDAQHSSGRKPCDSMQRDSTAGPAKTTESA